MKKKKHLFAGLFKVEWEGDAFVGLAAKTYYCADKENPKLNKYSSKGINKSVDLTKEDYLQVLLTKSASKQHNKGFLFKNRVMLTYKMQKEGLSYPYFKRKVLSDGISTTYLDL